MIWLGEVSFKLMIMFLKRMSPAEEERWQAHITKKKTPECLFWCQKFKNKKEKLKGKIRIEKVNVKMVTNGYGLVE